jgi:hypothetical protein
MMANVFLRTLWKNISVNALMDGLEVNVRKKIIVFTINAEMGRNVIQEVMDIFASVWTDLVVSSVLKISTNALKIRIFVIQMEFV